MKTKPSLGVLVLRGLALYAVSYGLYWMAGFMVGSPHEFRNIWAKAFIPLLVVLFAMYLNYVNKTKE